MVNIGHLIAPLHLGPGDVALRETTGDRLDCRQRGAQVVGDRAEQGILETVALAQRLRVDGGTPQRVALDRQGDLSADRLEQAPKRDGLRARTGDPYQMRRPLSNPVRWVSDDESRTSDAPATPSTPTTVALPRSGT